MTSNEFISGIDILENDIRNNYPEILDILLLDRTLSTDSVKKNIIWANNNYKKYGAKIFSSKSQIKPECISGKMGYLIKPRVLKSEDMKKSRTKSKAEVFTPLWVIKDQNDEIDKFYINDELETYIKRKWIEITCGEGPYIVTKYDMETGKPIDLINRQGFLDRKLKRISSTINEKEEWIRLSILAYQSSYGFEWNGDSLLLSRENLLYSFKDYYLAKWNEEPNYKLLKCIAEVISYNIFQMDGITYTIPLSSTKEKIKEEQLSFNLFEDGELVNKREWKVKPGKRVKIMNWEINKMEYFDKEVK